QTPFFGGTYFSPDTWVQILNNINNAFQTHREKVESTAAELHQHLQRSDVSAYIKQYEDTAIQEELQTIFKKLETKFDKTWGGMDKAPKFVMPSVWLWILRYYHITQDEPALEQVALTLKRIARGGIYDQIGGGFSRYSV